jgi:hypothetical protein
MALDGSWRGVPGTVEVEGRLYAARAPVYAVLLAGPSWVLDRAGWSWERDPVLHGFGLALLGVTIPVALGAGIVYRMGRLFELSRPRRAGLAVLVVMGSGWLGCATALNPHATAAALVLAASSAMLFVAASAKPGRVTWVLILAGQLASLAGAVDPWALPVILPMPLVVLAMRLSLRARLLGVVLMTLGAMPVVWLHSAWSLSTFDSFLPPGGRVLLGEMTGWGEEGVLARLTSMGGGLVSMLVGSGGLLRGFPVVLVGLVGMWLVMRRHWPMHAKMLAAISMVGFLTLVMVGATRGSGRSAMPTLVVISPLLVFWAGVIFRRTGGWVWRVAIGIVIGLSVLNTLMMLRVGVGESDRPVNPLHEAVDELVRRSSERSVGDEAKGDATDFVKQRRQIDAPGG